MAEQLHGRGLKVTIVESSSQLMAALDPELASKLQHKFEQHGVEVLLDSRIKAFEAPAEGSQLCGSEVVFGDEGDKVGGDVVIVGLGVRPDSDLAKDAGLELNERGGIVVDEHMRTSDPHIWAVGDAIEVSAPAGGERGRPPRRRPRLRRPPPCPPCPPCPFCPQVLNPITGGKWMVPLAGPANRQGHVCADNLAGRESAYKGTYGSCAVSIFGVVAAATGLNERGCKAAGIRYACAHLHPKQHAGYYPGATTLTLKVIFRAGEGPDAGKLLGAQAVGADGADKTIDTLATALQAGMDVRDLAGLELCYAPQVGSARAQVNYAGMIATDMLDGLVSTVQWCELGALAEDPDVLLLDVRSAEEVRDKPLHPAAANIPLPELRGRLGELPADKTIITSCFTGARGYNAARILMQHGFDKIKNLDGAMKTLLESPLESPAA